MQIGMHMEYSWKYKTPEGFDDLVMCGDDEALTELWFEGSRDDWRDTRGCVRRETPAFRDLRFNSPTFLLHRRGASAADLV